MSTLDRRQRGTLAPAGRSPRDGAIDLVRAVCLVAVVILHAMMVGVTLTPSGPVFTNAMEGQPWFAPASWVVQMMPLFFIVGGFSSYLSWQRGRRRGVTDGEFVAARIRRLMVPAIVALAVITAGLIALTLSGVPAEIVAVAGFRISQPLWFLGVYVLTSWAVPALARLHVRAPILTVAGLGLVVIAVDSARILTGFEAIGFVNLLAVWLLVQQLGFWLADGRLDRLAPAQLLLIAGLALTTMLGLVATGLYSADLYVNLNPPTVMLVLLGIAQLAVMAAIRPALTRWSARPGVLAATTWFNGNGMTIYLWHMPLMIGLTGLLIVAGAPAPELHSDAWWLSRPLWLALVAVALVPLVYLTSRPEKAGARPPRALPKLALTVAPALAGSAVLALLVTGFAPVAGIAAVIALGIALTLSGVRPRLRRRPAATAVAAR